MTSRLPPPLSSPPCPLFTALHQAPDGSGCVREEGCWNSQGWRRVNSTWTEWSLITAGRLVSSSCIHAGVLVGPGRERRGISLPPETWAAEPAVRTKPHPRYGHRARMPGQPVLSSTVGQEVDEAAGEATVPHSPVLRGKRVLQPVSTPCLDPSFQNTAPPSQTPQHDEDTRSPVYFGHFIPFGHFILLFMFNKSLSEAWRHTHCVCNLLFPPQYLMTSFRIRPCLEEQH